MIFSIANRCSGRRGDLLRMVEAGLWNRRRAESQLSRTASWTTAQSTSLFPEESRVGDAVEHPALVAPLNASLGAGSSAMAAVAAASDGAQTGLTASHGETGTLESTSSRESGEPALRHHSGSSTGHQHQNRQIEFQTTAPCNCTANTHSNDRRCAHIDVYQMRIPAINVRQQWNISSPDPNKDFVMWLVDEEHFEDHLMCVLNLVLCVSLAMVLTFAWLEADLKLAGWPWLLAAVVAILLALQTCIWTCFGLYSLSLYLKAYADWKTGSRSSLGSRQRHRRTRGFLRRRRSRGPHSMRSDGTPSASVADAPSNEVIQAIRTAAGHCGAVIHRPTYRRSQLVTPVLWRLIHIIIHCILY
ncbi:hypothetical protein MTO96_025584 [Rhipicephalus appendiculatus]